LITILRDKLETTSISHEKGGTQLGCVGTGAYFILFHVGARVHNASFSSYFNFSVQVIGVCMTNRFRGAERLGCPPDTATTSIFPWVGVPKTVFLPAMTP
jgi:hypothetical protein